MGHCGEHVDPSLGFNGFRVVRKHHAAGGKNHGGGEDFTVLRSVERYDAEAGSRSPVANMTTRRCDASSAMLGEAGSGGGMHMDLFEALIDKPLRARS